MLIQTNTHYRIVKDLFQLIGQKKIFNQLSYKQIRPSRVVSVLDLELFVRISDCVLVSFVISCGRVSGALLCKLIQNQLSFKWVVEETWEGCVKAQGG